MARDTIDAVVRGLGEDPKSRKSTTATTPLVGAAQPAELDQIAAAIATEHGLARPVADRLVRRHGRHATEVAALGAQEQLLAPLGPDDRSPRGRGGVGARVTSTHSRSTTSCPGGCGCPRSCRTAGRRSRRALRPSLAASWAGTTNVGSGCLRVRRGCPARVRRARLSLLRICPLYNMRQGAVDSARQPPWQRPRL